VREVILGVVVLLCLYLAYVVMRLFRVSRPQRPSVPIEPEYETILDTVEDIAPTPPAVQLAPESLTQADPAQSRTEREAFDALVELARLRFQVEALEASNTELRDELANLRETLSADIAALRNARSVSPQYGEAVVLAQRGLETDAIAERCGISISEAELVAALARGARSQE